MIAMTRVCLVGFRQENMGYTYSNGDVSPWTDLSFLMAHYDLKEVIKCEVKM